MLALFNGISRKLTYCKKLFFATSWISREYVRLGNNLLILRFNATANSFRGSSTCESLRKLSRKLPTSPTSQANIDWVDWQENLHWHWLTKNHCCTMLHYWKQRTSQCSRLNAGPTKTLLLYDQQSNLLSYAKQWWIVNCDLKPYSACQWSWWVCS
jgi:hypothetical protein